MTPAINIQSEPTPLMYVSSASVVVKGIVGDDTGTVVADDAGNVVVDDQ